MDIRAQLDAKHKEFQRQNTLDPKERERETRAKMARFLEVVRSAQDLPILKGDHHIGKLSTGYSLSISDNEGGDYSVRFYGPDYVTRDAQRFNAKENIYQYNPQTGRYTITEVFSNRREMLEYSDDQDLIDHFLTQIAKRMITKEELRAIIAEKGKNHWQPEIRDLVSKVNELIGAYSNVMFYAPTKDEVNIQPVIDSWLQTKGSIILPAMHKDQIVARKLYNKADLQGEKWTEPKATCEEIDPKEIQAVLVPGRAFDRQMNRMGRGRGHYDQFLSKLQPYTLKLGVAFSFQVFDAIPVESHDAKMNRVITIDQFHLSVQEPRP